MPNPSYQQHAATHTTNLTTHTTHTHIDTNRHKETHTHTHLAIVGTQGSLKNSGSHIDASHSRQPLVKGERLVRYEVNAVILYVVSACVSQALSCWSLCVANLGQYSARQTNHEIQSEPTQLNMPSLTHATHNILRNASTNANRNLCKHVQLNVIVTPKGVLLPALCHASATREGPWASSRGHLPREKLMWQASLQLETYQLSHW